jgi:predicted RNase H-like HicB family nuclease
MRKIIIRRREANADFEAACPSLGIASVAESIYEAFCIIYEVIALHIEHLIRCGYPVPPDDADVLSVEQSLVLEL